MRHNRLLVLLASVGLLGVVLACAFLGAGGRDDDGPEKFTNSIRMQFVKVPAGSFLMGSPKDEEGRGDDETQHEVKITRDFYVGVFEVTQGQYEKIMGVIPSHFSAKGQGKDRVMDSETRKVKDTSNFPVEQVSWQEAKEFCKKLSELPAEKKAGRVYRLPAEAEWEYACRAGAKTPFSHGKALNTQANFCGLAPYPLRGERGLDEGNTTPVGNYKKNDFGLFDMHGNVQEWCEDWYGPYATKGVQEDPRGPETGKERVYRGGCWLSTGRACRAANRNKLPPTETHYGVGFRVVLEIR